MEVGRGPAVNTSNSNSNSIVHCRCVVSLDRSNFKLLHCPRLNTARDITIQDGITTFMRTASYSDRVGLFSSYESLVLTCSLFKDCSYAQDFVKISGRLRETSAIKDNFGFKNLS